MRAVLVILHLGFWRGAGDEHQSSVFRGDGRGYGFACAQLSLR